MTFRTTLDAEWRDEFILTSELATAGMKSKLFRGVGNGEFVKIVPGVYLPAERWAAMRSDPRYLARVRAVALAYDQDMVFSHESAAACWNLPMVGTWPNKVHVIEPRTSGGRSDVALKRHCEGLPVDTTRIDGLRVTSLARTLVDVGRTTPFGTAVAMMDFGMRPVRWGEQGFVTTRVSRDELSSTLADLRNRAGSALCRRAISFADGLSGSPGESVSRVAMHLLGLTPPQLQVEFRDDEGRMITDFFWPEFNVIGEFDGKGKYLRDEYLQGRTTAEVVLAEKDRENRLRTLGFTVVRWEWADAISLPRLRTKLLRAGIR